MSVFREILTNPVPRSHALALCAEMKFVERKFTAAKILLRNATRSNPLSAFGFELLARYLLHHKNWRNGYSALQKTIILDPANSTALRLARETATKLGIDNEMQLRRSFLVKPTQTDTLKSLISAASKLRNYTTATGYARRILLLSPSSHYGNHVLSVLEVQSWNYTEAYRELRRSRVLQPGKIDFEFKIGQICVYSGRYAEAVEVFSELQGLHPRSHLIAFWLGRSLLLSDSKRDAEKHLNFARQDSHFTKPVAALRKTATQSDFTCSDLRIS